MKAKSFIVALVAVFAAIAVGAMATSAKATISNVTISATPTTVVVGHATELSGTVSDTDFFGEVTVSQYAGAGCQGDPLVSTSPEINWLLPDEINGTWSITSPTLADVGTSSFGVVYDNANDGGVDAPVSACTDVTVVAAPVQTAENETWACYSHFQDAPMAVTVSQFNFLTKALQPEIGMKPYWSNGFIPFANKTAASGQAIGNGYYLHCNLAGPPVTPGVWVNSDGVSMGSNVYADWVAEFGAPVTDPAGKPAAFNFYPVVAN